VRIVASYAQALEKWQPSTRLSPIFGVEEHGTDPPHISEFDKTRHLIFLGPIHPELVGERIGKNSRLWLTLGLFNVLVATNYIKERRILLEWAKQQNIRYEAWTLGRGIVKESEVSLHDKEVMETGWRTDLAKFSQGNLQEELHDAVKEYCPLMASTLARSEQIAPAFIPDLKHIQESVVQMIKKAPDIAPNDSRYVLLGQLLTINASLSRFASQTFAGTTPIAETECHFWSHSLLGIGVANIGLWKLREFLQRTLGEARIPTRFGHLADVANTHDLTRLAATDPFWSDNHLGNVKLNPDEIKPLVPLITYFSARDGFKSVLATISAPLATVAKCNSLQWSLNTMSHEITHVILRSVLADLYPDLKSHSELKKALSLYRQGRPGETLFEELRRLLLITIVKMESPNDGPQKSPNSEDALRIILETWQREVEEILVHVFDLLYFYGSDPTKYITGIWLSWGTIPHINRRVREYVIRSVCAVLAKHLMRGGEAENQARQETLDVLYSLPESDIPGSYLNYAIALLKDNWDGDIENEVLARKGLVKIARTFLFSSSIAKNVRQEFDLVGGTEKEKEGYSLKPGVIELRKIYNPLHFLELFTKSKKPSEADSLCLFYVLAFCVRDAVQH
jgi:hypothetical protein